MANLNTEWFIRCTVIAIVLLSHNPVEGAKKKTLEVLTATGCLNKPDQDIIVKCPKVNANINIKSVSYAHTPDCTKPAEDNDCVQTSADLSRKAQSKCNGKNLCKVEVLPINRYQSEIQSSEGELIQREMTNCGVDRQLVKSAPMNIMQIKFECEEYAFCNAISSSVPDMTIATKDYPAKSVTNPSCSCTFESEEANVYAIVGYARCNGSVLFVVEETGLDDEVSVLEYECKDKMNEKHILLGNKQPWKIKLDVDVEKSDEESSYEVAWFNVKPQSSERKSPGLIKADCKAGSLWLPKSVKLILMIVLPIGCALLVAAIVIYCICKKRRKRARRRRYEEEYILNSRRMVEGQGEENRTDPAADGKSASSMYDQPEPWHSNPEVQMNELAKPRYKTHLHKSHSAIPSVRNNDLALSRDPRLSRSRQSIRSLKRQAPQPPGQPPKSLADGSERRALLNPHNIEVDIEPNPRSLTPTAPSATPPRGFASSTEGSPRSSPLDNLGPEPMVPYRRKHEGRLKSPKRNLEPSAPLSLLTLEGSYTQPPKEHHLLTRNYSGKSNRSTPQRDTGSSNQTPDNSRRTFKRSVSPQPSNTNNNSSSEEDGHELALPSYPPAEITQSDDDQDDMTIMRPRHSHGAVRGNKPFTGYRRPDGDDYEEFTNINPGDENEFHG